MPFHIVYGDITQMQVDAIVNAASVSLKKRPGICAAIFHAAGEPLLQKACRDVGYCPPGKAVITPGFHLPARFIIHTASPGWFGSIHNARRILKLCYFHSMGLAAAYRCKSLAFPLIFSGDYAIPRQEALKTAVASIQLFLQQHPSMEIYLVLYRRSIYEYAIRTYGCGEP